VREPEKLLQQVRRHVQQTALLHAIDGLLGWDQQTKMPPRAGPYRAEQVGYLSGLIHQRATDPNLGQWLAELAESPLVDDPDSDAGATIRWLKRDFDRQAKQPEPLVTEIAKTCALGQQAWVEARSQDDFAGFRPTLEKIVRLKREQADAIGFTQARYDALLDEFEPAAKTAHVTDVLTGLKEELVPLVQAVVESGRQPNRQVLKGHFPVAVQERFGTDAAQAIGFDFQRGRLDVTHHPFCAGAGPHDVRITTRYDEQFFNSALFSILHEAGHGIYEQGLPADEHGLPLGQAVSLGIHESQSRLWENLVGRSSAFWRHFYPQAQTMFPQALRAVPLDDFVFAINDVQPSLIRVEADEVTYNLHILVRFELEQALLADDLPVADLPEAWREKYRHYLGIEPPNHADGVLQDVHWSAGLIGYFPTYSLGNLYAAQFFEQAAADLGDLNEAFARGDFAPLRQWLSEKIFRVGRKFAAADLCQKVTGKPLSHAPLMRHLQSRFEPLFGLA